MRIVPETEMSLGEVARIVLGISGGREPAKDVDKKQLAIGMVVELEHTADPKVAERIAKIAELAIQHGATVFHLVGALAVLAYGTQAVASPPPGSRPSLVAALHQQLGADIKIVHGAADGCSGLFGAKSGLSYTFFVPQFDRVLGVLSRLPLGSVEEFRP